MPLINSKSKSAFKHNVSAEIEANKPVKQAVAIAYEKKRTAMKADKMRMHELRRKGS